MAEDPSAAVVDEPIVLTDEQRRAVPASGTPPTRRSGMSRRCASSAFPAQRLQLHEVIATQLRADIEQVRNSRSASRSSGAASRV
jgi:hypothetical protein